MNAKRQTLTARLVCSVVVGIAVTSIESPLAAQSSPRVIVVTLDGVRWQEVFDGADRGLITSSDGGVRDTTTTLRRFWRDDQAERRRALMPFLWGTVNRDGLILGDSANESVFRVSNGRRFSYPGYSELFVGEKDDRIDSNRKIPNPNVTVLEWLSGKPGFRGQIEIFGSWDVFPSIFNTTRSGLPVNGDGPPFPRPVNATERTLNQMTEWLPSLWSAARLDAPTMSAASEALRRRQPRIVTVLLGETDEWAHDRRYDQYLDAATRADRFIEHLWSAAQAIPAYRGRTTLLITTDHGRGNGREWTDHGDEIAAADRIWMALLGPRVVADPSTRRQSGTQSQFAATIAAVLGEDWQSARVTAAKPVRLRP